MGERECALERPKIDSMVLYQKICDEMVKRGGIEVDVAHWYINHVRHITFIEVNEKIFDLQEGDLWEKENIPQQ